MRRGRDWIEDQSGTVSRPVIEETHSVSQAFADLDQGTSFRIAFSGKNVRPSNLGWYQARTAEQWLYILLVKTPLGAINLPNCTASGIVFDLKVIDIKGEVTNLLDQSALYKFPNAEIRAGQKLITIISIQRKALDAGKYPGKAIDN
jgi:hypothetical protein